MLVEAGSHGPSTQHAARGFVQHACAIPETSSDLAAKVLAIPDSRVASGRSHWPMNRQRVALTLQFCVWRLEL